MSGICAGNPKDVFFGDVIVATRLFSYDTGKLLAYQDSQGQRHEDFFHDITTYNLRDQWRQYVERFPDTWGRELLGSRPLSYQRQEMWLRGALFAFEDEGAIDPRELTDRKVACPSWPTVIDRLRKQGHLRKRSLALTKEGRAAVGETRIMYPDTIPQDPAFKVHLGPIGTGTPLRRDPETFSRLEKVQRKTLGIEMEAAAIGLVQERWQGPIGVYPESGYFTKPNWSFVDIISPGELAAEARKWTAAGVRLIGGCCGTGPEHIRALNKAFF